LPSIKGQSRQYSATLPKEKNAYAAVKAGLNAALRGAPVPSQWQGRFDRAKVALDIATKAKTLGISLNFDKPNYNVPGYGGMVKPGQAAHFGGHIIGNYQKGNIPTEAELASRIAAAAAMTGVSIPRGMQAEIEQYTTPAQIAATASIMQMEAGLKNPGTFPGYSYSGGMVNRTGHAAVDVPAIRDNELRTTPQGIAGWGQPTLSALAGIPSEQKRSVGIPGEDPMSLPGWGIISDEAYRDYTDVLANEQLGVPDLPAGISLADLGEWSPYAPDYSDISQGLYGGAQPLGITGSVNAPNADPSIGPQPDFSSITSGILGDAYNPMSAAREADFASARGPATDPYGFSAQPAESWQQGVGVDFASPTTLGTDAFPAAGRYDDYNPMQIGQEAFPDTIGAARDAFPSSAEASPFASAPLGAPQSFNDYAGQPIGYSPDTFGPTPNTGNMSISSLSPIGQGVVGPGYNPSAVAASQPIGAPAARDMSFDQMTRGIVGYEDKPVTTTQQVPNPAYADWQEAFNNPKATPQAMYADDLADKIGVNRGNFAAPAPAAPVARGTAPSPTMPQATTKMERSPVYGDVPAVGAHPVAANLTAQPQAYTVADLVNQARATGVGVNALGQYGLQGFTGNFDTGMSIAGLAGTGTQGGWGTGYGGGFSGEGGGGGFASQGGGEGFSGGNSGGFSAGGSAGGPMGDARNENW
jgi:hypothetical protein